MYRRATLGFGSVALWIRLLIKCVGGDSRYSDLGRILLHFTLRKLRLIWAYLFTREGRVTGTDLVRSGLLFDI